MMSFEIVAPTTRRGTMRKPVKTGGGWTRMAIGRGRALSKTRATQSDTPAKRPAFLGLPGAARHVTRTAGGQYAAAISDELGQRQAVGVFADIDAALMATRTAFAEAASV